jgi:AbrB family looped-hinge helix DNA binding protein
MKVADEAWVATALLQSENPQRGDFAVQEIRERARREGWDLRPGFHQHVSSHCIANKPADPADHRMLYGDSRGRRRLYREGDPFHPDRREGKVRPEKQDLPQQYHSLIDWYDAVYAKQVPTMSSPPPSSEQMGAAELTAVFSKEFPLFPSTAFVSSAGAFVIPEHLRKELGIREGTRLSVFREEGRLVVQPVTREFVRSLAGCCKGETSLVEAREREHWMEK